MSGQQGQPQHGADVEFVDLLGRGDLRDGCVRRAQRKRLGDRLDIALSMCLRTGAVTFVPSGARTSFRPPRLRIEMGGT
jgi:hypothetical protein